MTIRLYDRGGTSYAYGIVLQEAGPRAHMSIFPRSGLLRPSRDKELYGYMIGFNALARLLGGIGMAAILVGATPAVLAQTPVTNQLLVDFENAGSPLGGAVKLTTSNAPVAFSDTGGALSNVTEGSSKRLRIDNADGGANGCVITIPNILPSAGNWLVTADIKVVSTATGASGGIDSFGMAVKTGGTSTAKIPDMNAGYVMNLSANATNAASLGYQTIAAAVQKNTAGTDSLTIYFSTDPSYTDDSGLLAGDTKLPTTDGNHRGTHRVSAQDTQSWAGASASNHYVLIDNIRLIGPGNFGEDRIYWLSVFDPVYTQSGLTAQIDAAANNNFNTLVIQARYRADRSYRKNRDFNSYPNSEVAFQSSVDSTFDPVQYAIDYGREKGLRVYAAWSLFLVTDGSNTFPGYIPSSTRTYMYNSGTPALQTTADDNEGLWMDPGDPATRTYNLNVVMDFLQNYDVDGIVWDRVRFGGQTFGYNPNALAAYGYATGSAPTPSNSTFIGHRQQAVATFLKDAYTQATNMKPWLVMSAAPIAYLDKLTDTYNGVFQSWPVWNTQLVPNRSLSFGALDLNMPQFYRQWDTSSPWTGPAANQRLMLRAAFGDITANSRDTGTMPGAFMNVSPLWLFDTSVSGAESQSIANQNAQNSCDTRGNGTTVYPLNGWGIFRGGRLTTTEFSATNMSRLRAASTTPCGTDILASAAAPSDFLFKANYDKTAPNPVTGLSVTGGTGTAALNWTAPTPAVDGEGATRYLVYRVTSAQRSTDGKVRLFYQNLLNRATTVSGTSYNDSGAPAGTYYYAVVAVDDYNNKSTAAEFGPVTVQSADVVIESCVGTLINTNTFSHPITGTTRVYQELNSSNQPVTFSGGAGDGYTSSKSSPTNPSLSATRSRISQTVGQKAVYRPNISVSGYYDVFITLDDASSGPSNNANANWSLVRFNGTDTGSVRLYTGAGGTTGLANAWYRFASNVPLKVGQDNNLTLTNVDGSSSTQRFCMDAVLFKLVTADPLPNTAVGEWSLY